MPAIPRSPVPQDLQTFYMAAYNDVLRRVEQPVTSTEIAFSLHAVGYAAFKSMPPVMLPLHQDGRRQRHTASIARNFFVQAHRELAQLKWQLSSIDIAPTFPDIDKLAYSRAMTELWSVQNGELGGESGLIASAMVSNWDKLSLLAAQEARAIMKAPLKPEVVAKLGPATYVVGGLLAACVAGHAHR